MASLTYFSESSNISSSSPPQVTEIGGATAAADGLPQIPHHSSPPSSSSYGSLSPSILIIILILGVTVFASVTLCIILRHINHRCLRHLSSSSSSVAATTITASAAVSSRRVSPESLSDSLLDSLPLFVYRDVTRRGGGGGGGGGEADCAVCLSKFELDDELRLLPCCHAFHAACVDTWLRSSQTCPLCRSPIFPSEADILKALGPSSSSARLEIGSVSRREATPSDRNDSRRRSARSYSIGSSFEYFVDDDSEVVLGNAAHRRTISDFKDDSWTEIITVPETAATEPSLAADVASSGRSWLKDYVDRLSNSLSSRAASFRSSGRFFGGSSRRSDVVLGGEREWDLEASRVGEEISELFRWVSGV